ncbi:protein shisa-5-like isoform X2 [Maniola hyperantus]|uniref:protein shisa-5-like isoform X2 n=1 Tax=Aphantopus hyperantus TaxID=2795564 RepID=UPI0021364543
MFGEKEFSISNDYSENFYTEEVSITNMSVQTQLYIVGTVVIVILLIICCCRCCCRRERGQVLTPAPTHVQVQVPAPYPQQQYNAPYPTQVITTYPVHTGAQVAYPHPHPHPQPGGYHYPPQPGPAAAPYPTSPYPSAAYPPTAPSAPEANAMPPSYDQAVCSKPPPNNPYASH